MAQDPQILMLVGSARRASFTRGLARAIGRRLEARGAALTVVDLFETPLPALDLAARAQRAAHPDPAAAHLFRAAETAEAYVLASPVYHNSYSSLLKGALDHLMLRDLRYRPVGLASHGGRSTQAVDHLRQVTRGLLGVAIPTQVCTREDDFAAPAAATNPGDYEVQDPDILARIDRFAAELILFARHLRALRAEMEQAKAAT
jgi:NAD(P)H-dependent FMN reductase